MKSEDISKLAVVYARYSSSGQREESIDGQLAAARKYADAKGYTIIREYIDRAKTGRNDNRDDFQQMLSDTATKTFSVIIVWKVDRFGRNREEVTFNKYRCKKNGVHVEYVAESVPEGPEGVILESVLEGMAEYYSLQLSQNVKRGLLENAKQHKAVSGTPPLGYRLTPDKHFEIDPKTAPLVKLIFERYANGESLFDLIRYLNENGYTTIRGGKFQRSSLDKTLRNEQYIGVYKYKDIIRDENAVPAIIDKDTFYKVQNNLQKNKRTPPHKWKYADYILTGKLFCGKCGEPMVGKAGHGKMKKVYNYYACQGHLRNNGCDKKAARQDWIETLVMNEITRLLADDDLMEFITEQTWQYYLKQDTDQIEIKASQKQLSETNKAINNLVRAVENGMPYETVKIRMEQLNGEKAALERAIAEKELAKGFKLTRDHIVFFLEQFRDLDTTDRSCQKKLINVFVNAIYLYEDTLKIAFNYSDCENHHAITLSDIEKPESDSVCSHTVHSPTLGFLRESLILRAFFFYAVFFFVFHFIPFSRKAFPKPRSSYYHYIN